MCWLLFGIYCLIVHLFALFCTDVARLARASVCCSCLFFFVVGCWSWIEIARLCLQRGVRDHTKRLLRFSHFYTKTSAFSLRNHAWITSQRLIKPKWPVLVIFHTCLAPPDLKVAPTEVRCEFLKSSFFVVAVFLWSYRVIIRINMHREATRNPHMAP